VSGVVASEWFDVARASDIPRGEVRTYEADNTEVAIFNLDGELYALEDICTHDGGYLASGEIDGDHVICPRHGAHFDIKTGAALCAPAYEPVPTFEVRIDGERVLVRRNALKV
jgi:3-phenylpropionate/trans-cinnamate dioxygenase ferredoxin component